MPRSAGNPNMSGGLDASGSSSMGDIFQSFRSGDANWGKRFEKKGARSVGRLTISGLGPDVGQSQVRTYLEQYYNTIKEVRMLPGSGGSVSVSFGFAAERDKAVGELNGRELHGHRISVHKQADPDLDAAAMQNQNRKRPREDEIHELLRQYQALRAARDYRAADALLQDLKSRGVLVDPRSATWRSDDGKTGMLPSLPPPVQRTYQGGGRGGGRGPAAAPDPAEEARLVCVDMKGDSSYGTSTLTKIFQEYNLEVVHPPRDGYATMVFADAPTATYVLSLAHYTPTGKRLSLLAARQLREMHEQASAASAAAAAEQAAMAAAAALPDGWTCGWSAEHGCWYYCNASQGVTQWEPPATPIKSIVPYPDSEEEPEEQEHEEAAAEEDHATAETMTPLMIAATAGEAEQLGLLLEGATAATLRETDGQGRTALHLACLSGSVECVTQLVSAGADVTLLTNAGDGCIALARQANLARKTRQLLLPPIQMTERQAVRTSTAAALQEFAQVTRERDAPYLRCRRRMARHSTARSRHSTSWSRRWSASPSAATRASALPTVGLASRSLPCRAPAPSCAGMATFRPSARSC
eukprot:Transcript_24749.p1 GENE.Transcript_24749~~Transcript_24749.p1  ORF type:complete len:612 (+),score=143.99 Transcript_24749:86-1837(+)